MLLDTLWMGMGSSFQKSVLTESSELLGSFDDVNSGVDWTDQFPSTHTSLSACLTLRATMNGGSHMAMSYDKPSRSHECRTGSWEL